MELMSCFSAMFASMHIPWNDFTPWGFMTTVPFSSTKVRWRLA